MAFQNTETSYLTNANHIGTIEDNLIMYGLIPRGMRQEILQQCTNPIKAK